MCNFTIIAKLRIRNKPSTKQLCQVLTKITSYNLLISNFFMNI